MYIVSGASRGIGKFIFESLKSQKNVIGLARKADPDKNIIECDVSNFGSIKSAHEIIKKDIKKFMHWLMLQELPQWIAIAQKTLQEKL